jgi:hypothetical protein
MAKRMTATEKWDDPWFQELDPKYKIFWMFILDKCDHAGIWQVNIKAANFFIGATYNESEILEAFKNRIVPINGGDRWFVKKFIEFQYGELNPANRAHLSVIQILKKYSLIDEQGDTKGLISPYEGYKDKDKDKDKDKCIKGGAGGNLQEREQRFADQVRKHPYPEAMLTDFIRYWTEPNKSGTKLKFELQTTWDTARRLATWAARDKNFQKQPETVYKQQPKEVFTMIDHWDRAWYEMNCKNSEEEKAYQDHLRGLGYTPRLGKNGLIEFIKNLP